MEFKGLTMIICICANVNSDTLKSEAKSADSVKDLIKKTGACSDCKTCYLAIKDIYNENKKSPDCMACSN